MEYKEIKGNILTAPADYMIAQFLAADFVPKSILSFKLNDIYGVRNKLLLDYPNTKVNYWDKLYPDYRGFCLQTGRIFNLIIKRTYDDVETSITIKNAFEWLKEKCEYSHIKKVAISKQSFKNIDWNEVMAIIYEVFWENDIEIVVYEK